ncbi:SET domain-containing protein [Melia azedarach]|uniref:SET domain-containing protein n=1 Tax=Melia azedarach TaxID=155640 RepID=A0ACC1X2U7_MELAZ|nr:SET domain-containing protein [Melia azedarach]
MESSTEARLQLFLRWLQVNKVELRGCEIKYSDETKGFGIFSSNKVSDGVLLVVPLDLAITPMRVLQDPLLGPECGAMFEEGDVDDRFLMILFLTVERLRKNSSWKPYLDMLPTSFGNPLWFNEDELLELKGTALYRATELQKQKLLSFYDEKVKDLVKKLLILDGDSESEVSFEDFLWANSVFWSRALTIPLPRSFVFPQNLEDQKCDSVNNSTEVSADHTLCGELVDEPDNTIESELQRVDGEVNGVTSTLTSPQEETLWIEGLVPGIDFCNHDLKAAAATWEVDGTGSVTGVPSMYLLSVEGSPFQEEKEITISYGNKGNEELLYLYGFVIDNNPDDYLMVHCPVEAIQSGPLPDSKAQLLEAQKVEMRCLLPRSLLEHGFFPAGSSKDERNSNGKVDHVFNFSWSGHRRTPSYLSKLVFPENFLTALRTIAMREDEYIKVSSLLEELVGSGERQPSDTEIRAAVWEACGDSGALKLLVDLLHTKLMDLEESSGTEDCDSELLAMSCITENHEQHASYENNSSKATNGLTQQKTSRKRWSSIIYRRGQKELTRSFLKEAEHALQLALSEGN